MAVKRLAAVVVVLGFLTLPAAGAAPPTIQSYSTFTASQFEEVAASILAIPQVASQLADGSVIQFVVSGGETYEGQVQGSQANIRQADTPHASPDLKLTASANYWGSLLNACDRANTAKLGIRDGYVGIDGSAAAKAAANGARTGRLDAQLAAQRPAAGVAFPCAGETPTVRSERMSDAFWGGKSFFDEVMLTAEISGRSYVLNRLGALEGQLPSGWLSKAVHEAFGSAAEDAAYSVLYGYSSGTKPIPAECSDGVVSQSRWARYAIATCMQERGVR